MEFADDWFEFADELLELADEFPEPCDELAEPCDELPELFELRDELLDPADEFPEPCDELPEPADEFPEPAEEFAEFPELEAAIIGPNCVAQLDTNDATSAALMNFRIVRLSPRLTASRVATYPRFHRGGRFLPLSPASESGR